MAEKRIATKARKLERDTKKDFSGILCFCALVAGKGIAFLDLNLKNNIKKRLKKMNKASFHEPNQSNDFLPIPEGTEIIAKKIVDSAYTVHKNLGPGLLEKVYEVCFCHELKKRNLKCVRQLDVPIVYDGIKFDEGLRLDVLVEDAVICEIKAIENVNPVWEAQILSHLKLCGKRLGFLINFNVVNIGQGIRRFIM